MDRLLALLNQIEQAEWELVDEKFDANAAKSRLLAIQHQLDDFTQVETQLLPKIALAIKHMKIVSKTLLLQPAVTADEYIVFYSNHYADIHATLRFYRDIDLKIENVIVSPATLITNGTIDDVKSQLKEKKAYAITATPFFKDHYKISFTIPLIFLERALQVLFYNIDYLITESDRLIITIDGTQIHNQEQIQLLKEIDQM